MMNKSLQSFFLEYGEDINRELKKALAEKGVCPELLAQAMDYAVFPGGKRIRPLLTLAFSQALGGETAQAMLPAIAIELIHSYSLVHDDLPCMDDDDMRRGKPSTHCQFGYANAVLTGDALLTKAFEVLGKLADAKSAVEIIKIISRAAGAHGMVGGQVLDMLHQQDESASAAELALIHKLKTGALIAASCECGAVIAGCDKEIRTCAVAYGEAIGLAFQIVDDILDHCGDSAKLGKHAGKDAAENKLTFVKLYGVEESKVMAREAIDNAFLALTDAGIKNGVLHEIGNYIIERDW